MNRQWLVVIFFLILAGNSYAQYKPGYIIMNESDTLHGYVRWIGEKIYHKPTKRDLSDTYDLDDIEAFGIMDREFERQCVLAYIDRFPQEMCGFLELVEKGYISLYRFDNLDIHGDVTLPNFYVHYEGGPFVRVRRSSGFKKEMSQFFKNAPEIVDGIKSKKYTWENVRQMVSDFNEWKMMNNASTD